MTKQGSNLFVRLLSPQDLEDKISMLEEDTLKLQEDVEQAHELLTAGRSEDATLVTLPSEAGKVCLPAC